VSTDRKSLPAAYRFIAVWLRPILRVLTKRDWRGVENLPRTGGFVAAPNHVSYFDAFAVALFLYDNGTPPYFLGKEVVFRVPFVGWLLTKAGQIPVYRGTGRASLAFRAAAEGVEAGKAVVVFPEGTLTRDPGQWPMTAKTGAARVALQTGCPVIPIAQWGPQEVLGTYQRRVHLFPRKTMHLLAGPPVDLSDLYGRPMTADTVREATDRVMEAITRHVETLRGEKAPAVRFDSRRMGVPEIGNPNKERRR
jgi:1-acyl-sn-glycerol-3-phosphate acyltransferase